MRRFLFLLLFGAAAPLRSAAPVDFPTANHSLVNGPSGDFFMYVDRDFEGKRSKPWQGGQYGFVRGPKRYHGEVVCTAMHEGIDIRPLRRDPAGNPQDRVLAAADGHVAYVNPRPSASNYGRYVVIEHRIDGSPYYTLYAHLAAAAVAAGSEVRQGQPIGVMGYTGDGINRERAHVHFEFALMANPNFDAWHSRAHPGDPNPHGAFNGRNLMGVDPASLLLAARKPGFDLRRYLREQPVSFKVAIPAPAEFPLLRNYPWLLDAGAASRPPGWLVSFSQYGVPVRVEPFPHPVSAPFATWTRKTSLPDASATRGLVTTSGGAPELTKSGRQFLDLLCMPSGAR